MQQSRSITLILLNQPQAAVASLQEAIDTLKQTSKEQIDSQQRLGNCWRLLASQENLIEPNPSQEKLERWLGHLDRAKEIHQHLFEINGTSAEIRFDLAQTCCSRARVLANLGELDVAGRFEQALRELGTASELLKELAADFRRTPGYELLRISALQLQATIYVDQMPSRRLMKTKTIPLLGKTICDCAFVFRHWNWESTCWRALTWRRRKPTVFG